MRSETQAPYRYLSQQAEGLKYLLMAGESGGIPQMILNAIALGNGGSPFATCSLFGFTVRKMKIGITKKYIKKSLIYSVHGIRIYQKRGEIKQPSFSNTMNSFMSKVIHNSIFVRYSLVMRQKVSLGCHIIKKRIRKGMNVISSMMIGQKNHNGFQGVMR
ncbi:MAG: hypothetical protein IKR48_07305 [Kiritimatiellae bacterium]|nr:hypothetical protein [Kiritimatiellia bacterium]